MNVEKHCEMKINICDEIYRTMSEIDGWLELVRKDRRHVEMVRAHTCDAESKAFRAPNVCDFFCEALSHRKHVFTRKSSLFVF